MRQWSAASHNRPEQDLDAIARIAAEVSQAVSADQASSSSPPEAPVATSISVRKSFVGKWLAGEPAHHLEVAGDRAGNRRNTRRVVPHHLLTGAHVPIPKDIGLSIIL